MRKEGVMGLRVAEGLLWVIAGVFAVTTLAVWLMLAVWLWTIVRPMVWG